MSILKPSILVQLYQKMEKQELPILKKSAARVMELTASQETEANTLAQVILQDQPFTARLLRMANSFHYNRSSQRHILSVTRAIMLVGYSVIRDLSLASEFAEFAQRRMPEGVDLKHIIAKAFLAANQAAALGQALKLPDAENLFTSALLRSIGELALAYYFPSVHLDVQAEMAKERLSYEAAYSRVVGSSEREAVRGICERLLIPKDLVSTTVVDWARCAHWGHQEKHHATIDLANHLAANLLSPHAESTDKEFDELTQRAAKAFHMDHAALTVMVKSSFDKTVHLADMVKLDPQHLLPTQSETHDTLTLRDELVDACTRLVPPPELEPPSAHAAGQTGADESIPAPDDRTDAATQESQIPAVTHMNFLAELGTHMLDKPDFNTIMNLVLEGLHRAVGFTHTFLLLSSPKDRQFVARLGFGPLTDTLLTTFTISQDPSCSFMADLMDKPAAIRLAGSHTGLTMVIPPMVLESLKPTDLAIGPLRTKSRVIGLIWADATMKLTPSMWSAFELFVLQANLGLHTLGHK